MTDEEIVLDIRKSCEALDDLTSDGYSWGDKCVKDSENRIKKVSEINSANAKARWEKEQSGDKPSPKPKRPPNVSEDGEVIDPAEIDFESFRVAFPGTRAGHDSALKIFKNVVGKSWREIVPKLLPAVELEKEWHKKCDDVGAWHQPWAMLTTWIRQRRWEQEFTEPVAPPASKRAQPKTFAQIEEEEREQSYRDAQARLDAYGK